ncbi:thiosulfate sulfurtransferase [Lentibacillus kapialis]|uniref:Thiosulfate sulfurtransferase n=1 Tax=Lentibacillus kapialis TaxID=340214 RepID=A0A917Q2M0_9BACI|nr:sulfurtransferase [Lentibacillus kapialis]GGK07712.1 thiosulfate sulfurtransferase [Lentibacillus kapialis]
MSVVVSDTWLKKRLENDSENTVVVDTRFDLTDADAGRKAYLEGHIPQAVYLDLNKDLSDKAAKHGGSHPLPDMEMFTAKIGNIGIDHETTVVIYDQRNDMFAARLWWLLQYAGHADVHLLDGGFEQWVKAGYDITAEVPALEAKEFKPSFQDKDVVDIDEVQEKLQNQAATLIDSRSQERYLGKTEPLYIKAGHIPGAKNFFWKNVFDEKGQWKGTVELEKNFGSLSKDDEIIVSCGSGVSACPNVLALKTAGFENVKLYPGSFSDWISYDENDVETKDE